MMPTYKLTPLAMDDLRAILFEGGRLSFHRSYSPSLSASRGLINLRPPNDFPRDTHSIHVPHSSSLDERRCSIHANSSASNTVDFQGLHLDDLNGSWPLLPRLTRPLVHGIGHVLYRHFV